MGNTADKRPLGGRIHDLDDVLENQWHDYAATGGPGVHSPLPSGAGRSGASHTEGLRRRREPMPLLQHRQRRPEVDPTLGRPQCVPLACARRTPAMMRSRASSCSNSAKLASR